MTKLIKLIRAANGNQLSDIFDLEGPQTDHTIQVKIADNGSNVTALTVILRGGIDGINEPPLIIYSLTSEELAEKYKMFHVPHKKVKYISAELTGVTFTGPNPEIDVFYY